MTAPLPGLVKAVHVDAGQRVGAGEVLIVIEAMKMEHSLTAPIDAVVGTLNVAPGDQVAEGALLLTLEDAPATQ